MSVLGYPIGARVEGSDNPAGLEHSDILPLRPKLSFVGASYERNFVQYYQDVYYRYAQASLGVGLMLVFADFLVDYFAFRNEPDAPWPYRFSRIFSGKPRPLLRKTR